MAQSGPAFVVDGSDRRRDIEYDLLTTNATPVPVTLTSIDVLGPQRHVLLRLRGRTLGAVTTPLGGGTPSAEIPASSVVDTLIDVVLPRGRLPAQLSHRIRYTLPPGVSGEFLQSKLIRGPRVTLDPRRALIVAPPLRGPGWAVIAGCCSLNAHTLVRFAVNGSEVRHQETFANDWVREQGGREFTGAGAANGDYFAFGAVVSSATSGVVTSARDGFPDQIPTFTTAPTGITEGNFLGNYVTVRVRPGVYALYAHLERGSVAVKVGRRVRPGQRLARLGTAVTRPDPIFIGASWTHLTRWQPILCHSSLTASRSPDQLAATTHSPARSGRAEPRV